MNKKLEKEQIKKIALQYLKDDRKFEIWYKLENPVLNNLSPKQVVQLGKSKWVIEECEKALENG